MASAPHAPIGRRVLQATLPRTDGRGLDIVDALADAWSIDMGPPGTKVTIRLSVDQRAGTGVWTGRADG